jgi:hypothetical protein
MLPHDDKPWAKGVARTVIGLTVVALALLTFFLQARDMLHIPEIVGIFLLFLTIVPPNLAVLYPWLLTGRQTTANNRATKSTIR